VVVMLETSNGRKPINVCDGCRTVCVPWRQRFCSGACARSYYKQCAMQTVDLAREIRAMKAGESEVRNV
jgi:hypothetical protein